MGLAVCKGIVDAHWGHIWAESEGLGLGSRITFTIPAVQMSPEVSPDGSSQFPQRSGETTAGQVRILVVDDDQRMQRHVKQTLSEAGYKAVVTGGLRGTERLIEAERPDIILVDPALPGSDGFELMKRISDITDAQVIVLSTHTEPHTIASLLDAGMADYLVKPFSPVELVARVRAVLRRGAVPDHTQSAGSNSFSLGDLNIDYARRQVTVAGRRPRLTETEYRLLVTLSTNSGRVLTHDYLLQRVWGINYSGNPRLLQAFIKTLRRKLGDNARHPRYIFTEFRVGYYMPRV